MNDRIGQQLGNYRLMRKLGSGGFAEVYLGEHVYLKTQAAIKVLQMQLVSQEEIDNFTNEARMLVHLKHPNIIPVLDFGIQESTCTPFLVMDYAPNGTLRQRYPPGSKLSPMQLLPYIKQVAEALQYAHDRSKLVHCDIKPENILLGKGNTILLSDFGLATVVQSTLHQPPQRWVGTLPYTAPERLMKGKSTFASDQYSLGIIAYELLTGGRPFTGSPVEIIAQHIQTPPPPLQEKVPTLSPAIEQVVQKSLMKAPEERYTSVRAFALALEEACRDEELTNPTLSLHPSKSSMISLEGVRTRYIVATPPDASVTWNVPHPRNPFFTGQEHLLANIHDRLHSGKATEQVLALSGLGGIGKTQIAVEYAYRYHDDYRVILWLRCDKRESLLADSLAIATLLNLKERQEQDRQIIANAIKTWLRANSGWLLLFDTIDDLTLVKAFLPSTLRGHVLLTTRTQTMGTIAQRIDVENMTVDEGALFLLRRVRKLAQDAPLTEVSAVDRAKAKQITETLGGHPLALDQAGAYIEENECGIAAYACLYTSRQAALLNRRGGLGADHLESVTATFVHSFRKIEQTSTPATELLHFCSFLHPDAIPEDIITLGAAELGPILYPVATDPLKLNEAIAVLRKHSLVRRNPDTKLLSIHPLVQEVHRERMSEQTQREWAERTLRVVNRAWLDVDDLINWHRCQLCFPHALKCVVLIERWKIMSTEAVRMLEQTGKYLRMQAQYIQADDLFQKAATMRKQLASPDYLEMAASSDVLFWQYYYQGKYTLAEPFIQKELILLKQALGADHQQVAACILSIGQLYYQQGRYSQAEELFFESLKIREQNVGWGHPCTVCNFNWLGWVYLAQGKYALAETYFQYALSIWEEAAEPRHPLMGNTLNGMAKLSLAQGKHAQAELYLMREKIHLEQAVQPEHPAVLSSLSDWATLYTIQARYNLVEPSLNQAQMSLKLSVGMEHPLAARTFSTRARFYFIRATHMQKNGQAKHEQKDAQAMYAEADLVLQKAHAIYERTLGIEHPEVAATVHDMASVYTRQSKWGTAEELYKQALTMRQKIFGPEHPSVAQTLNGLGQLYFAMGNYSLAEQSYRAALSMREKLLGAEHPDLAQSLNDLARLYANRQRFEEAEPLYQRALLMRAQVLGAEHPDVATTLKNYAFLLAALHRDDEAAACAARAKAILAKHAQID